MVTFSRHLSSRWHEEVPGARWFKADLHIHTLDDHQSGNLKRPSGIDGAAGDAAVQTAYARSLLRAAIENGIEVLGLTPHSVKCADGAQTSATWRVVEVWNNDLDDDGVPFRDKIYAVFPGFEPNLRDSDEGLHLLFLFDPEIGRETYTDTFAAIMGGVPPWNGGVLRLSGNDSKKAFEYLRNLRDRLQAEWAYLCLAAHAFSNRGLFSLKSEMLQVFPHESLCGLELKDNWLPKDAFTDKPWLKEGMDYHRHALFHSSDAYSPADIGKRFTLLKLAQPRIESLRQAFLAYDSRLRIAYRKNEIGEMCLRSDLPDPRAGDRPWLRSAAVKGGTSFFGGLDPVNKSERSETFLFNPDLTCVIGGRMAGKSTLLDGLRVWFDHPLPTEDYVRTDVIGRGRDRFLSGGAEVSVDIRGPANPEASNQERWAASFYTQRELQRAVDDQELLRQVLYRLIPTDAGALIERARRLRELDRELIAMARRLDSAREALGVAEQAFRMAEASKIALERVAAAGVANLTEAQADEARIDSLHESLIHFKDPLDHLIRDSLALSSPEIADPNTASIMGGDAANPGFARLVSRYRASLRYARRLQGSMSSLLERATQSSRIQVSATRDEVQAALIAEGGTAEDLNRFDAMTECASDFASCQLTLDAAIREYARELREFIGTYRGREALVEEQRRAMNKLAGIVSSRFGEEIRIRTDADSDPATLEEWVLDLRERGITRWWNDQKSSFAVITPKMIRNALRPRNIIRRKFASIGISDQVAATFGSLITAARRYELYCLRNDDRYHIEVRIGAEANEYRDIGELSGGAQVGVLLSLVLETEDSTPLVIDQPEDELDKNYLFRTLLPALRKLKGRRQIIVATHDANIVVNGDADHVIYLEADHRSGHIAHQGTIEEQSVRDAILTTLDGGRDAFTLRQAKYGF